MDIGNQQRVIIVEVDPVTVEQPKTPVEATSQEQELEMAAAWPLPLDFDPESVG